MDLAGIGAVGSAGAQLAGGILGAVSSALNRNQNEELWQKNYAMQKEFAQNSIQWRVQDALKAGINPLAALGGQGSYASPTTYVDNDDTFSELGRGISRAGDALGDGLARVQALQMEADTNSKIAKSNTDQLEYIKKLVEVGNMTEGQLGSNFSADAPMKIALFNNRNGVFAPDQNMGFDDYFSSWTTRMMFNAQFGDSMKAHAKKLGYTLKLNPLTQFYSVMPARYKDEKKGYNPKVPTDIFGNPMDISD